ncbi:sugar ABC transporter ATP-binding protein [Paenibacillus gorillae]|uniref:sugar ABC transporter ATP-binding protein n=1 Tax=Paenibacillus gorillae TaxID=1243662 RepID=UPI0004AFE284|nr:sugar ABC transporter ATP-binding protein [Paenibacillus gorillae]
MKQPILELKNIVKEFYGNRALSNVSLTLMPGSVHAIVGENGAGKSTFIKILTGAYSKTSGDIYVGGELINQMDPLMSKKLGIHCIYQELNVANDLTVAENVFLGIQPVKRFGLIHWKKMNQDAKVIFDSLQIRIDPKQLVRHVSIAQKQMIEIARAISQQAKVLIMDEPTSSLSDREIEILLRLIGELKQQGIGILYISHRMDEIFRIADTVTVLRDGQHIKTMPLKEVSGVDELVELMANRKVADYFNKVEVPIGKPVLKVEGLSKSNMFHNIGFELREGEIVGIAGLVGSGRTEIAMTLFGMLKKDSGTISIDGRPVDIRSPRDAIKLGIGFVTENRKETGLALKMSVRENMTLPTLKQFDKMLWVDRKKESKAAEEYRTRLNIKTTSLEQQISKLSGGNQQKAIIARWMIQGTRILILDEPCRGVDVRAKAEIFAQISKLAQQGITVLMISSEIQEIVGMSDRVIVMKEGHMAGMLEKPMITPDHILKLAFGGANSA